MLRFFLVLASIMALPVLAQERDLLGCEDIRGGYGPFDYRTATPEQKRLVEGAHFTPGVESLLKGHSSEYVGADIDYTLRAFPNHPRALMAMVRLSEKEKRDRPRGATYTVECYFDRATRFAPDDSMVLLIKGIYLLRKGDSKAAAQEMENAQKMGLEDPNLDYNLGLAYLELGQHEKALKHAKRAYAYGHPLPALREKLVKAGIWKE